MNNSNQRTVRRRAITMVIVVVVVLFASNSFAQFGGGSGTVEDPYTISRHEHLNNIKLTDDDGNYRFFNYHYRQTADIIFTEEMFEEGGVYYNDGANWIPIGCSQSTFSGHYDGGGFVIANLKINRISNDQGLFGKISGAVIVNTHVIDVDVVCRRESGGLVGHMLDRSSVDGCSATGSVRCPDPQYQQGGLIGRLINSTVSNSFSEVNVVSGNGRAGCLIGYASDGAQIINCYATGSVTSSASVNGGLVGLLNASTIINSYATGAVTLTAGGNQIGGLIGTILGNCTVRDCYATGVLTGTGGGLIGQGGVATNCYWDVETTGKNTSTGGDGAMGRLTRQMVYPYDDETFVEWDFDEIWVHDEEFENEVNPGNNNGYPYLYFQDYEPPIVLDAPIVEIDIIEDEENNVIRLRWLPVEDAVSYKIFASDNISSAPEEWGEPIEITNRTEYRAELSRRKFYYVVASVEDTN